MDFIDFFIFKGFPEIFWSSVKLIWRGFLDFIWIIKFIIAMLLNSSYKDISNLHLFNFLFIIIVFIIYRKSFSLFLNNKIIDKLLNSKYVTTKIGKLIIPFILKFFFWFSLILLLIYIQIVFSGLIVRTNISVVLLETIFVLIFGSLLILKIIKFIKSFKKEK